MALVGTLASAKVGVQFSAVAAHIRDFGTRLNYRAPWQRSQLLFTSFACRQVAFAAFCNHRQMRSLSWTCLSLLGTEDNFTCNVAVFQTFPPAIRFVLDALLNTQWTEGESLRCWNRREQRRFLERRLLLACAPWEAAVSTGLTLTILADVLAVS
jgi:hypothetical protein